MKKEMKESIEHYVELYDAIQVKTGNDEVTAVILQEIGKDLRTSQISGTSSGKVFQQPPDSLLVEFRALIAFNLTLKLFTSPGRAKFGYPCLPEHVAPHILPNASNKLIRRCHGIVQGKITQLVPASCYHTAIHITYGISKPFLGLSQEPYPFAHIFLCILVCHAH